MKPFLDHATIVIVLADHRGWRQATSFGEMVAKLGIAVEAHLISSAGPMFVPDPESGGELHSLDVDDSLLQYLSNQPIGSRVYVCGDAQTVKRMNQLTQAAGYAAEEVLSEPIGQRLERVFCIGCYRLNPAATSRFIRCQHCGRALEVSSHYSTRLDAVLGYLVVPEPLITSQEVNNPEDSEPHRSEDSSD